MSAFKEQVSKDIHDVFLNLDEFADTQNLNGYCVPCMIEKASLEEHDGELDGLSRNVLVIYICTGAIPTPIEGSILRLNGSRHVVHAVAEEGGMLIITAEANEQ